MPLSSRPDGPRPDGWAGADPVDLLIPVEAARSAAVAAALAGDWLDAFLLASGCGQVLEDHLHGSEGLFDTVSEHLTGQAGKARLLLRPVRAAATSRRLARNLSPRLRGVGPLRDGVLALSVELAEATYELTPPAEQAAALRARVDRLLGLRAVWPTDLAAPLLRLPSCFRSFDQHPADVTELAARFTRRWPHRDQPVLVVGVRTSGSYLGPLAVAALRRAGHRSVDLVTMRPGERLDDAQRRLVRGLAGGPCLVIDDPPVSGGAVRGCIHALLAAGLPSAAVVLLLALPQQWKLPSVLDDHEQVIVRSDDWHLTACLEPDAIGAVADRLLAPSGRRLEGALRPMPDLVADAPGGAPRTPREHRRATFEVEVAGNAAFRCEPRTLLVQGVGIGLFGRHDAAVAARLPNHVPEVLGVHDGLLYQLLAPAGASAPALSMTTAVGYVVDRHRALAVPVDRSVGLRGRRSVADVAGQIVGGALGPADLPLRLTVVTPLVRHLLTVDRPSIIDGRISPDRWVAGTTGSRVKLDFAEGAFSNRDLWSYDPVFDLAAVGDHLGDPRAARAEFAERTGQPVEPARWLLLRLVHAWDRHRLVGLPQPELGRAYSAAMADFVGDLLLADLPAPDAVAPGRWCALDVDGVLETGVVSQASAPGWDGGSALRALVAHGYRVVLATGRGAGEVAARRAAWGLPGAVAEYGTALVLGEGEVVDLRDGPAAEAAERARTWLAARDGVVVDPGHRFAVRAWRAGTSSSRGPLSAEDLAGVRRETGGALLAVAGEDQTDLVPGGCTKALAAKTLIERLDPAAVDGQGPLLAMAAGDGPADLDLLRLAGHAVVPSHASPEIRAAASAPIRAAYQAGLRAGVAGVIGHEPGTCTACRPTVGTADGALLTALSVREAGGAGLARRFARLAEQVRAVDRVANGQ